MPKDKRNSSAAGAITELGRPVVSPVMSDMIRWLRVSDSIVADILQMWPTKAVEPLTSKLTLRATYPDISNNDIECFKLILKHDLAETEWVVQWLKIYLRYR